MKSLYNKFMNCITQAWTWLILSYLAFFYFFCGFWGKVAVKFVLVVIVMWAIIHFFDWLIFDPWIHRMAEREAKREKERLHELTPRFK